MTMSKFDQIKDEWMANDEWRYAYREACWKYFFEAGRAAAMEPAAEEVKDAVQWISVDDRLPDLDTDVMVYPYPAYQVMIARFGFIQKKDIAPCWHFSEYILNYGWKEQEVDPTHWMPLPKTPVEEGEK